MTIKQQKRINAILFFVNQSPDKKMGRLRLMKLLWLSDRIHLNKYGRMILKDNYSALPHGPVPSKTMDLTKSSIEGVFETSQGKDYVICAKKEFDSSFFSKSDLEVMHEVVKKYGQLNPFQLRDLSHLFPEWKRYEEELMDEFMPNSYPMVIEDFFIAPEHKAKYSYNESESNNSKSYFSAHNSIQSFLSK